MKPKALLAAVMVFVCVSCAKKANAPSYKVEIVDGGKVVRNFKTESTEAFKAAEFRVDLSIGLEEGDENYTFGYPIDVNSDQRGNIYVLDYQDCAIKKYDPRGTFLRQIGRKGQGPGEFQSPSCLRISGQNEIYVKDENKIEVFSAEGSHQRTLPVNVLYFFDLIQNEDLIIDQPTSDQDGNRFHSLGKFDLPGGKLKPFFSQRIYWPSRITDDEFAYEFPYYVRWGVNSESRIYAASGVDYTIIVFDSNGNSLLKFTKDFNPVPVIGEELAKTEAITKRLSARAEENPYKAKLIYPAFKYISIDESDRIWVERYQPVWRNRANKETTYDVFSADGIFLFWTGIPGHIFPQLKFKNGFIYALQKHESGYITAVRIKMKE
jgi:hypothetical protein